MTDCMKLPFPVVETQPTLCTSICTTMIACNSVSPVYSACFIIRTYLHLDTSESRPEILGRCWNVVMEKISWTNRMKNEEYYMESRRIWIDKRRVYTPLLPQIQGVPGGMDKNSGVFLMLKYTDITQNTCIQSWTVTEIMAIEKCGLLGGPRSVRRPWRHIRPLRMPGYETS